MHFPSNHLCCVDLWLNSYFINYTYYRVFCLRHHSKNTVLPPRSLCISVSFRHSPNRIEATPDDPRRSSIDRNRRPPPSILLQWNYVGVISDDCVSHSTFARARVYVYVYFCIYIRVFVAVWVWVCMWTYYLDFYPCAAALLIWFKRFCCCCCRCCAHLLRRGTRCLQHPSFSSPRMPTRRRYLLQPVVLLP